MSHMLILFIHHYQSHRSEINNRILVDAGCHERLIAMLPID